MTVFNKKREAVDRLIRRLKRVPALSDQCDFDEDDAWTKLIAAEGEISRRVGILLEPTWVFHESSTQADMDEFNPDGLPSIRDPGYDYKPEFFQGEGWGHLLLRRTPVIRIADYKFVYNNPGDSVFTVPLTWIRLDGHFGQVRLLPTGELAAVPLSAYLLSVVAGGRTVPNMVRITYLAGIENIDAKYPDLLEFIFRVAALNYLRDSFLPTSESISADGLSESRGFDLKAYTDTQSGTIEQEYRRWQDHFQGPQLAVV